MATALQSRTFKTSIDLAEPTRARVIDLLNHRLADVSDLKTQTKHAHWNVKGKQFQQLHQLFDQVAARLEAHTDLIAERITALGGVANGTARQIAASTSLPEFDLDAVTGEQHVRTLTRNLARLAAGVREGIDQTAQLGDQGTSDLLTEVVRDLDKDLWFLEAHLQG